MISKTLREDFLTECSERLTYENTSTLVKGVFELTTYYYEERGGNGITSLFFRGPHRGYGYCVQANKIPFCSQCNVRRDQANPN